MLVRAAFVLLLLVSLGHAQNRQHPGLVHLGEDRWGTPEEALESGLFEHRGRWYPKKLRKKIAKWEKQDAKGLEWSDAYKAKTKAYRVTTNVPRFLFELEIRPFLDALFETYREVFERDFGLEGKAAKNKTIKIYGSFEEYSEYEGGRPRNNPGFIVGGTDLVVFYEEADPSMFYATVFHEGAHQFFLSLLPGAQLPIWLTEALAVYFEGCTYSRATGEITPGFLPAPRLALAKNRLRKSQASAGTLFMDVPKPRFNAEHYALAWSFLYYLIHRPGDDNAKKIARFLDEMNGAGVKPVPAVFEKATKERLEDLESGWREFVLGLEAPPGEPEWVSLKVEEAGADEDLRSGDLVWSLDGVEIYAAGDFAERWKKRPLDRPFEVVVVRALPGFQDARHRREIVRVTVQPGSSIVLRPRSTMTRRGNLLD